MRAARRQWRRPTSSLRDLPGPASTRGRIPPAGRRRGERWLAFSKCARATSGNRTPARAVTPATHRLQPDEHRPAQEGPIGTARAGRPDLLTAVQASAHLHTTCCCDTPRTGGVLSKLGVCCRSGVCRRGPASALDFVVIDGRRWPPKQVLALVTGLDRADFTTHQARGILTRLGFLPDERQAPGEITGSTRQRPPRPGQRFPAAWGVRSRWSRQCGPSSVCGWLSATMRYSSPHPRQKRS
jgi:hypothetical protein